MTGSKLSDVLTLLKGECGLTGTGDDLLLYQQIVNKQFWYADRFTWSFLEDRWDVAAPAQTQYLPFPTVDIQGTNATLRLDRPVEVQSYYNLRYFDLDYGISENEYNTWNPVLFQFQDPIQRWKRVGNDKAKFEVWPVPATPQVVRFVGQRALNAVDISNPTTNYVELDDLLIALTVAADYLKSKGKAGWDSKAVLARELLLQLRGNDPQEQQVFRIGKDIESARKSRVAPLNVILVHG